MSIIRQMFKLESSPFFRGDQAREQSTATIAHPRRPSAGNPTCWVHTVLGRLNLTGISQPPENCYGAGSGGSLAKRESYSQT
ncbi:MAG: hypothetical protein QGM50_11645 [Anaerolineae bacterium]|nr:hypothetical protein [Anaerolineae bacterium]